MASIPFDYYATRGLAIVCSVDEHYNWATVAVCPRAGAVHREHLPLLDRIVRLYGAEAGLEVCRTGPTEWTPLQFRGGVEQVESFVQRVQGLNLEGLLVAPYVERGLRALHSSGSP